MPSTLAVGASPARLPAIAAREAAAAEDRLRDLPGTQAAAPPFTLRRRVTTPPAFPVRVVLYASLPEVGGAPFPGCGIDLLPFPAQGH